MLTVAIMSLIRSDVNFVSGIKSQLLSWIGHVIRKDVEEKATKFCIGKTMYKFIGFFN